MFRKNSFQLLHITTTTWFSTSNRPPPTFLSSEDAGGKGFRQSRLHGSLQLLDSPGPASPAVYSALLRLCVDHRSLDDVHRVHAHASYSSGSALSTFLSNRLISSYAKVGRIDYAREVFDRMPERDLCSWNTLISGYADACELAEARRLFNAMLERDHFSWSTMVSGYVRHGRPREGLELYREMQHQRNGASRRECSNRFTASAAISACAAVPCLSHGKEIHGHILRASLVSDAVIHSSLADMYAKCGCLDEARRVFDRTEERDVVSWTAMVGRYFDGHQREEGFQLFIQMLREGVKPNDFTLAGVLDACSGVAAEGPGKQVHGYIIRAGFDTSSFAASALVHMYSKCGSIEDAGAVFEGMPEPDVVSWTSIISGYAQNGCPEEALRFFELLLLSGTKPDHVTFVGVLSACTHAGLVERGLGLFHSIEGIHGISLTADHYACVIDLLSRAGRFQEAEEMIDEMPMKPNKFLWASLLGGCRIHRNVRLAERAAEALTEIEPENAATYVTLGNIYASVGMYNEVEKIRKRMEDQGVVKKPGSSWIEVKKRIHAFFVGDKAHPRMKEIYAFLEKLYAKMKVEGYVPNTDFVLHDVEDEQKEHDLSHHSEKLAVAFGIIATPTSMPIKVFKNLRICGDCHTAIRFISRISGREIIVRDTSRFHHFRDGICSCKDYW